MSEHRPAVPRLLAMTGTALEVLGLVAQLLLMAAVTDIWSAWHDAFGLVVVVLAMALGGLGLLGSLMGLIRGVRAFRKSQIWEGPKGPVYLHGLVALFPIITVLSFALHAPEPSQKKAPVASPKPSTQAEYLEGFDWAQNHGIQTEQECTTGSAAFVAGAKSYVRRQRAVDQGGDSISPERKAK